MSFSSFKSYSFVKQKQEKEKKEKKEKKKDDLQLIRFSDKSSKRSDSRNERKVVSEKKYIRDIKKIESSFNELYKIDKKGDFEAVIYCKTLKEEEDSQKSTFIETKWKDWENEDEPEIEDHVIFDIGNDFLSLYKSLKPESIFFDKQKKIYNLVLSNPNNLKGWIDLLDYQSEIIENDKILFERKISILEKGLSLCKGDTFNKLLILFLRLKPEEIKKYLQNRNVLFLFAEGLDNFDEILDLFKEIREKDLRLFLRVAMLFYKFGYKEKALSLLIVQIKKFISTVDADDWDLGLIYPQLKVKRLFNNSGQDVILFEDFSDFLINSSLLITIYCVKFLLNLFCYAKIPCFIEDYDDSCLLVNEFIGDEVETLEFREIGEDYDFLFYDLESKLKEIDSSSNEYYELSELVKFYFKCRGKIIREISLFDLLEEEIYRDKKFSLNTVLEYYDNKLNINEIIQLLCKQQQINTYDNLKLHLDNLAVYTLLTLQDIPSAIKNYFKPLPITNLNTKTVLRIHTIYTCRLISLLNILYPKLLSNKDAIEHYTNMLKISKSWYVLNKVISTDTKLGLLSRRDLVFKDCYYGFIRDFLNGVYGYRVSFEWKGYNCDVGWCFVLEKVIRSSGEVRNKVRESVNEAMLRFKSRRLVDFVLSNEKIKRCFDNVELAKFRSM